MSDTAAVMTFHPRPQAGEPRPWAFPPPERGALGNGLTLLTSHRPGQQVIAVEVLLAAPLDAEPEGLDGVATIMARALSEGTDEHTAEEFAAELERCGATLDAHADHPGVRVSLEVPASRLDKALGLLAEALRAPAFPEDEIKRLVANRLDEIPHELANPGRRAAMALSKELFPAGVRHSRPRQGTEETVRRIDAAAVRDFYRTHVRPATGHRRRGRRLHRHRPARAAGLHPRPVDRLDGRARSPPGDHLGRLRPRGDRRPARLGADAGAHRPDRLRPA